TVTFCVFDVTGGPPDYDPDYNPDLDADCGSTTTTTTSTTTTTLAPGVHVHGLEGNTVLKPNGHWAATVTVTVRYANNDPVEAASVSAGWSNGAGGTGDCVTDSNGQCSRSKNSLQPEVGSVTYTVTDVIFGGAPYNSGDNHDPGGADPEITVDNPVPPPPP
ncbi:MAG: Ig-like domain-containing protein, partial [Proteobacteria bacterium]|nr:Ig-like domain-containing protein [Pseudomonadota bacterium]